MEPTILWLLSSMYAIFRHLGLNVEGKAGRREIKVGGGKGREREGEGGREGG